MPHCGHLEHGCVHLFECAHRSLVASDLRAASLRDYGSERMSRVTMDEGTWPVSACLHASLPAWCACVPYFLRALKPETSSKKMAYQKVSADQRAPGHSQFLDNDDLQATALDLEWDMEKELEEPGFDQFQLDSSENRNLENSETADLNLESIQPATSPKGRFQRLQEETDYVAHYTRSTPKSTTCNFCRLLKILCTAISLLIFGILIGYYAHKDCPSEAISSGTLDSQLYQEILKTIQAEDIKKSFR
ncbi:Inactive N-acetylated-alpha-linked acidic dipeptidase-like protein 2 [Galemys pyrenaicus]|uniref:Inactive N-acetylated-alpha-linked acidic dipeptidase-like protein 2 n=1 Tax=Galemys pyrenaicus TaxID=202257 RepID=A0A8J6DKY9_GALPY|nr:Inactive N-acetylated-alpha-linked acidic dipeptidase-like protein 2 [Galemys pyrenaicus]